MTKRIGRWLPLLALFAICPVVLAQAKPPASPAKPTGQRNASKTQQLPGTDTQKKNIQEYIELLRADVRQQKSQIMGAIMQLDVSEAAKFWPIYEEYDGELTTLNNLRSENIQEYARTYTRMTDEKAEELIKKALDYQKQRSELLGKFFDRVKQSLGAITAARFLQIENQLLLIIDLQIASSLPIVGQA
jgi:hypothetical protein